MTKPSVISKIVTSLRLGRALRMVWESASGWTLASIALLVIQGILPLASIYLVKLIVDSVTTGVASPDKAEAFRHVVLLVGCAGGIALLTAVCRSLSGVVSDAQSQAVTDHVIDIMHSKSIEVDLEYYESPKYYDYLHRAQADAGHLPTSIVNSMSSILQNSVSLVAILGLLFSLNWMIALLMFVAASSSFVVRLKYSEVFFQWRREISSKERECSYYDCIISRDEHAKEVRLFALGELFRTRYNQLRQVLREQRVGLAIKRSTSELAAEVCTVLAVFGSYAFIAYRGIHGTITVGDFVMYIQVFQRGLGFIQSVMGGFADLYEGNLFLSNLTDFLDLKPKISTPAKPKAVPVPMRSGVTLDKVNFTYPGAPRQVLNNIDMDIRPGQVVALVGENGSGKTTIIKLLCRLYDPTSGCIRIDNTDIREMDVLALQREIGVIFQDYARYNLTAHDNIWFGNIAFGPEDSENIRRAARQSGADAVIGRLSKGYDTILGRWFSDGEELSIGQWQKIALARAFLRNSQIICLDEPSSAMDPKAEYEFFSRFRDLLHGRSAVLISHRFSTVRMADYIYVLENGSIIEHGSHEDLLDRNGKYAVMFNRQAEQYV